jgi:anthranilate phosphoribosyltransferase
MSTVNITPQEALQRTIEHREIFHDEMIALMRQIMRGEVSPLMTAAIITGLRVKKETVGEITCARASRSRCRRPASSCTRGASRASCSAASTGRSCCSRRTSA